MSDEAQRLRELCAAILRDAKFQPQVGSGSSAPQPWTFIWTLLRRYGIV